MSVRAEEVLEENSIYDGYSEQAEIALSEIAHSHPKEVGERCNQAITLQYRDRGTNNPYAAWFAPATLASKEVGGVISNTAIMINAGKLEVKDVISDDRLADKAIPILAVELNPEITAINRAFVEGNQIVFKDIVALEKIYQEYGSEGIRILHQNKPKLVSNHAVESFQAREKLEQAAKKIAAEMGLDYRSQAVVEQVFKHQANVELYKVTGKRLLEHEQLYLERNVYCKKYGRSDETIGDILSRAKHPQRIKIADALGLTSIEVAGKR